MNATTAELKSQLNDLQEWFARKPYGFTETCSPDQLRQYRDREAEQDRICGLLELISE